MVLVSVADMGIVKSRRRLDRIITRLNGIRRTIQVDGSVRHDSTVHFQVLCG